MKIMYVVVAVVVVVSLLTIFKENPRVYNEIV